MSAVRENAKLRALELVGDMLRSLFANAAGEVAELQSTLIAMTAERDKLAAEVETLKAQAAEAEALRRAAMLNSSGQMSGGVLGNLTGIDGRQQMGRLGDVANQAGQQADNSARDAVEGDD